MLTRLEYREILAHINKANIDPDVLAKLMIGASVTPTSGAMSTNGFVPAPDTGFPPYVPITYTDTQLARIQVPEGNGTRPATQADVAQINQIKELAHNAEWRLRSTYKANLNENDVVGAAFAPPDREHGFNPQLENVIVGAKNSYGDQCIEVRDGQSIFRCAKAGHGYTQSRSLRSCSHCFLSGVASSAEDPGALAGTDSRW